MVRPGMASPYGPYACTHTASPGIGLSLTAGLCRPTISPWLNIPHFADRAVVARLRTGTTGKTWRMIQVVGFIGLASSLTWTLTTWTRGDQGQFDTLAVAGIFSAIGSLALTIYGRLGLWWFSG